MEQTPNQELVNVCDIQFRNNSKIYYFSPGELEIHTGDCVIIDTSRGMEFGQCVRGNHSIPAKDTVAPLREVIRIANEQDYRTNEYNREREKRAHEVCLKKIEELGLEMQLVSTECAFDGSKILFFFTADGRVDFRELVKILASILRTRIELRQIGVRDKAKMVGGLGICGRPFCCGEFLEDFQPVSIKMAKTQNLSLNPSKISGTCGRLMCCLNYEQEAYEDLHRTSPKPESFVDTPDGRGTVTDVHLLRQSVSVRLEKQPDTIVCHKNCDICVLRNGKAKKTDEPIPEDLAPISGNKPEKKAEFPGFSAYLEPVAKPRKESKAFENEPTEEDQEDKKGRRRRNKAQKPVKSADVTAPVATPEVPEVPVVKAEKKEGKPPKKDPNHGKKDAKAPKKEHKAKPTAPKELLPAEVLIDAEGAEIDFPSEAAPRKPRHHYHHRYHKHRKPGNKPGPTS